MIKQIILKPQDIMNAKLFKYKKQGRMRKYAVIMVRQIGRLYIPKQTLSHIFRYIPYTQVQLFREDYQNRDQKFLEALQKIKTDLLISYDDYKHNIIRITSDEFVAIPHKKIIELIEQTLPAYTNKQINFNHGMYAEWVIKNLPKEYAEVGDIVNFKIWTYNYNIGDKSLRIGGGFNVLACKNGALGWKGAEKIRIIHRGDYDELLGKIQEATDKIINRLFPKLTRNIKNAINTPFSVTDYEEQDIAKLLKGYPRWLRSRILVELRKAKNWWDVSNIFSYLATHEPVSFNQKIKLANQAIEVLEVI